MGRVCRWLLLAVWLIGLGSARAELVVVMAADAGIERLSHDEVINIFLGRHRLLPNGRAAQPIDLPAGDPLRVAFYRRLVGKEPNEINAYWARLYFSGKTAPPLQATSLAEAIRLVLARPGGITYLPRSQLDARLQVVLSLAP